MILSFFLLLVIAVSYYQFKTKPSYSSSEARESTAQINVAVSKPDYVGAVQCQKCHSNEFDAWAGSHHALAMQDANETTVLGDFNDTQFNYNGIQTTFYKKDNRYFVRTDGPDGNLTDYPIRYTFGVTPLQQYLIEFPGGRFQALSIAWDSRSKAEGGKRWFHLYPDEKIDHKDQLHWAGRYQNWNLQCAECHSTRLEKNYDMASDTYQTRFSEINVACEACHGPGSKHLEWASQEPQKGSSDDGKGFTVKLDSRWQDAWSISETDQKIARRDYSANEMLMNVCWSCHARRSTLIDGGLPGKPLEDSHRPALLTQPTYHADGQQRDEVYTWGSFRQSKMFQNGVTCMDCHEPHGLKLRAEGNALCTRCHKAEVFDTGNHHFHPNGSTGSQCVNCHAAEQNYMIVDGRHDHSFRIPRPDLSDRLNSPNACTQCHQDHRADWAASAIDRWLGKSWRERAEYGSVLHDGTAQGVNGLPPLLQLAQDGSIPAVVRATAAEIAQASMQPQLLNQANVLLTDKDPSVRIAAMGLFDSIPPGIRVGHLSPLLSDPVLGVRVEAARLLADVADSQIPTDQLQARQRATDEYLQSMKQNADWPVQNVNLGNLSLRQGKIDEAIAHYQRSLKLDPKFVGAYINLADAYRQQGKDLDGEKYLRKGLTLMPEAADLHHALGLSMVRQKHNQEALKEFARAAQLASDNPRFAYVYGIALNSAGKSKAAIKVLADAERRNPFNPDLLSALVSISREAGDNGTALVYAKKAAQAMPDHPEIQQLINELAR